MSVYKDEDRGTWYAKFRSKNWKGETKWVNKRGFATKRDAQRWEREYRMQKNGNIDMDFGAFVQVYEEDVKPRLKESTFCTKASIIEKHLLPHFQSIPLCDISTTDILRWHNELLLYRDPDTGKPFAKSYLKTIHNQLSAIFNHAVRYYKLPSNPARTVGNPGSEKDIKMKFWTKEEYLRFAEAAMDCPIAYYCFETLYWCGIREGELLALTPNDIDLDAHTLSVDKTYHRMGGRDIITDPKTAKSRRTITVPEFLCEELREYLAMQYDMRPTDRMFPVTKGFLCNKMEKYSAEAGVKRIRIHDLRHSHVSLLINMGFSALAIAERMGHESIDITYRYAHLFPSVQKQMAEELNKLSEAR